MHDETVKSSSLFQKLFKVLCNTFADDISDQWYIPVLLCPRCFSPLPRRRCSFILILIILFGP